MSDLKKIAIKGTTQQHLPIEDITEDLVILKDGSAAFILETPAVNFDLLSEREQEAMIYAYGSLLNSLKFPMQILIRSSLKHIGGYLRLLQIQEQRQKSPRIKKLINSYRHFVDDLVQKNEVLTKAFYVVIPFSVFELGLQSAKAGLGSFLPFAKTTTHSGLPFPKDTIIQRAKANLEPKRDQLINAFGRLGLRIHQLNTRQLINLFYQIYNEEAPSIRNFAPEDLSSPVTLRKK